MQQLWRRIPLTRPRSHNACLSDIALIFPTDPSRHPSQGHYARLVIQVIEFGHHTSPILSHRPRAASRIAAFPSGRHRRISRLRVPGRGGRAEGTREPGRPAFPGGAAAKSAFRNPLSQSAGESAQCFYNQTLVCNPIAPRQATFVGWGRQKRGPRRALRRSREATGTRGRCALPPLLLSGCERRTAATGAPAPVAEAQRTVGLVRPAFTMEKNVHREPIVSRSQCLRGYTGC